jgi:hypothetical protein
MPNGGGFIAGPALDNVLLAFAGNVDHCLKKKLHVDDKYCLHVRYSFILGGAKMLFFWLPVQKQHSSPKVNKLLSTEEIICTTGFDKLPGFPQRS